MYTISQQLVIRKEQYGALLDLNRVQSEKNDLKLKARKAVTAQALDKLKSIQYR